MLKQSMSLCFTSHVRDLVHAYLLSIGKQNLFTFLNTNLKMLYNAP